MNFENDDLRQRYALVIEGQCPVNHGGLERRDIPGLAGPVSIGWCGDCEMGWRIKGTEVTCYWVGFGQHCFATTDAVPVPPPALPAGSG